MGNFLVVDGTGQPLAKIEAETWEQAESLALRTIVGTHRVLGVEGSSRGDIENRLIQQFEAQGLSPTYARIEAQRTNVDKLRTYEAPAADPDKHLSDEDRRMAEAFRGLGMTENKIRIATKGRRLA